jgi:hypothetical protein
METTMAHGTERKQSAYGSHSSTGYAPESPPVSRATGRCSCHSETSTQGTCCDLTCFERPRYFCGHLLTDADLSLDQRYVIEKHKLYHRALHGHGIVCGLRLTCDPNCCDHVVVDEGLAIDDCGHDLVVCERTSFDVVARLRQNKLLGEAPPRDDCAPGVPPDDCPVPQCFYVIACYDEDGSEYATPLTASCGPGLSDCEPTRVRESVRFDVVDKLPEQPGVLDDLQERIEHCFALFTAGPFAEELKSDVVARALRRDLGELEHEELCQALCRLKKLFELYLDKHPDHYNCRLRDDLDGIKCPTAPNPNSGQNDRTRYQTDTYEAFCRIVDLAYSHVMGCVFGELAFPCASPSHSSCVVLGTVEVDGDCVVRVCNCPRSYVWSFASFFQVLMATLFGSVGCGDDFSADTSPWRRKPPPGAAQAAYTRGEGKKSHCCSEFEPAGGCLSFVERLRQTGATSAQTATATLDAVRGVARSLEYALAPTRDDALLLQALRGRPTSDVIEMLRNQKIQIEQREAPETDLPSHPLDALSSYFHQTAESPLVVTQRAGVIVDVREKGLRERVADLEKELSVLRYQLGTGTGAQTARKRGRGGRS